MSHSRRQMLGSAAAASVFSMVPAAVLAAKKERVALAPSEKLNLAFVGVGGRGKANVGACSHHNVYAICDVDRDHAAENIQKYGSAKFYSDWRALLDKEAKNIDAVVVSTPDHCHAVISMAAMQLGLGVYCEKPLTRTLSEARLIAAAAKKYQVATQMGNQGHSTEGARMTNEWVQSGLLGDIREVHCWTNRPSWPQGVVRPAGAPVPATLNWDVWLGPAPDAPYSPDIAPFKWRGYWEYGAGALGDMGAHILDHPVWALNLGAPVSVVAEFERESGASAKDTYPAGSVVTYRFAARGKLPPVTVKWFDGRRRLPPVPPTLEAGRKLPSNGVIYYGSKHCMMHDSHGGTPRVFPETEMKSLLMEKALPAKTILRSPGHYEEWFQAVKAKNPSLATSEFGYAGALTETILLGCLAQRVGPGIELEWDSAALKTNNDIANRHVHHEYRNGWSLG